MRRHGLKVIEINSSRTSLAEKLATIYEQAKGDFIRVDADVIPNRHLMELPVHDQDAWWIQGKTFGWYAQDLVNGGIQFIRKEALPHLRVNIGMHLQDERPETAMSRLEDFYNPRRFLTCSRVVGLHGWHQNDLERVKATKQRRGQLADYDFELVERMEAL